MAAMLRAMLIMVPLQVGTDTVAFEWTVEESDLLTARVSMQAWAPPAEPEASEWLAVGFGGTPTMTDMDVVMGYLLSDGTQCRRHLYAASIGMPTSHAAAAVSEVPSFQSDYVRLEGQLLQHRFIRDRLVRFDGEGMSIAFAFGPIPTNSDCASTMQSHGSTRMLPYLVAF
eukprot:gene6957-1244_t